MRLAILATLAAVPLSTPAAAAEKDILYSACQYQDGNTGINPFTSLFVVDAYALKDGYGEYTYDKNKEWEALMAADMPNDVRSMSSYNPSSLVGQFKDFATEKGDIHAYCWVTTEKERAFRWYRAQLANNYKKADGTLIRDWRPKAGSYLRVEPWPPM